MHGLGNDFVVLETDDWSADDWAALAVALCPRRTSVGADGLLAMGPSERADFRYRMFNPDGSEDMCGNGLRCVAWRARGTGRAPRDDMVIESLAGPRRARVVSSSPPTVRGEMGHASFRAADLPAAVEDEELWDYPLRLAGRELRLFGASTGTPHVAVFDYGPEDSRDWERLGAELETHELFPERTSTLWLDVISRHRVRMRIWERASGATLACGTGACAAAAIGVRRGLLARRSEVEMPGGSLIVEVGETGDIRATGPVASVFAGRLLDEALPTRSHSLR
jgi:diaminopimelate epimerase